MVSGIDQALRIILGQARQAHVQVDVQAETTGDLTNADVGGDRSVIRDFALGLAGDELQGADKAGRVAGGKQLFRVGAWPPAPPSSLGVESLTSRMLSLETARPSRPPVAVATAV
ncbi:hypothetical protein AZH11_23865 [Pseudomonas simiae]|nr:hypothetical protein AZH11_23865 [Pseudomonas simiae]